VPRDFFRLALVSKTYQSAVKAATPAYFKQIAQSLNWGLIDSDEIKMRYLEVLKILNPSFLQKNNPGKIKLSSSINEIPQACREREMDFLTFANKIRRESNISELLEFSNFEEAKKRIDKNSARFLNITALSLESMGLFSIPKEIGYLKNLRILYVGFNKLETLPPEIGDLKNLKWLYANSNKLETLPAELGKLKNFTKLHMPNNPLTKLPAEIRQLVDLERGHLSGTQLKTLQNLLLAQKAMADAVAEVDQIANKNP